MEKRHFLRKSLFLWLPFAALATVAIWFSYFLVQQDIRISANYPQSQIAEDSVAIGSPVDLSTSLAPFSAFFDANGNLMASNAVLHGKTPVPPPGVFVYARAHGEDRFTWQPESDVRIAAVLVYHPDRVQNTSTSTSAFTLSGRSLRDVETLEGRLSADAFAAWLIALIATLFFSMTAVLIFSRKNPQP